MRDDFAKQWIRPWVRQLYEDNRTEPGTTLIDIDWADLELRALAHYYTQSVSTPAIPRPNRAARRKARSSRK